MPFLEYYEDYGIRRYGFHGTSHKYVAQRCAELMGKHMSDLRISHVTWVTVPPWQRSKVVVPSIQQWASLHCLVKGARNVHSLQDR